MLVEVSSRTIIQFLEMFMDLWGQREADLKCICGYVIRGHKDRDDVWFCVLGRRLKGVTLSCRGCGLAICGQCCSSGQNAGPDTLKDWVSGNVQDSLAGMRLDMWS